MANRYSNYEYQHVSEASPIRKKFKNIFEREIENSKYMTAVKNYFEADYKLINTVEFYGTR